jgi:flagellar motor switch protein FliM
LVDRLLGGNGQAPEASRDLSEIETVLTDQITGILLSDWCGHWTELGELRPAMVGHETNGRFLQGGGEGAMLVLDLNLHIGDQIEALCLAFPYGAMEALVRELASTVPTQQKPVQAAVAAWKPEFNDVKVPATAEWRGVNVTARELAALKPGDVLMLGNALEAEVQVQLNRVPAFRARPGLCGSRWAVQLTAAQE